MESRTIEVEFYRPMRRQNLRTKQLKKYWLIAIIILFTILLSAIIGIGLWFKAELSQSSENSNMITTTTTTTH